MAGESEERALLFGYNFDWKSVGVPSEVIL